MKRETEVYAWYFPNWHPDERNEKWHGTGWTEWEVVKNARPRFEGHKQPKVPLWGYEDESDPHAMEKKIETAKSYGIDGFLWDMYWFEDGPYRLEALNKGFFGASNNEDFKIALMWCNHDPIYGHPATYRRPVDPLLSGDMTVEGFYKMTDYFIQNYFWRPNYIKFDDKILFVIWNINKLVRNFGGAVGTRAVLDNFRDRVRKAGLGEVYIGTVHHNDATVFDDDYERVNELYQALGIDGGFRYSWMTKKEAFPTQSYESYMEDGIKTFEDDTRNYHFPIELGVCSGWDTSPRTLQSDMFDNVGYPFTTVVTDNRPELFQKVLEKAKQFAESKHFTGHAITISCWNEWTEGSYLEPDEQYGYAMLEAVRNIFGSKQKKKLE